MTEYVDFLGPEPVWVECSVCGTKTSRAPDNSPRCWDCTEDARQGAERLLAQERRAKTIPPRYAWAKLGAPELAERVQLNDSVEATLAKVLAATAVVFAGAAGSGKTSFAVLCLRERLGRGGMFFSAPQLGRASRGHPLGRGVAPLIASAMEARLALIDDVGNEGSSVDAIGEVLFERHDQNRVTWITTGLKYSDLELRYNDGIGRRMVERATIVRLGEVTK